MQGDGQADSNPDRDEDHRFPHHEAQNILPLCAERHADADLVGAARHVVGHQPEEADRGEQQREAAKQRVGLREELLLNEALFDLLDLRRHIHDREVRIDLPDRFADRAHDARRRARGPELEDGRGARLLSGTYMVGGAGSRTSLYLASCSTPTISSCPDFSGLEPNRLPIGFSFGKYFRTAASLMTATFGDVLVVALVNPCPITTAMPITSKKFGETTSRLTLRLSPAAVQGDTYGPERRSSLR